MERSIRWAVRTAAVAIAYYVAARVALLLAIPPGFATAVWPPAGIAFIAMLAWGRGIWPGILLGSTLANLPASGAVDAPAIQLASAIAAGAALQAAVGAGLVRRYVGFPTALDSGRDVIGFLGLGGPVACLVNATIGPVALLVSGAITASRFTFTAWTWWVGDVIGVLTIAPLLLVAFGEPRGVWRRRALPVALPLVVVFALSTAVFVRASALEQDRIEQTFSQRSTAITSEISAALSSDAEVVASLAGFLESAPAAGLDGFERFTTATLARHEGIQALSWNPVVGAHERDEFERRMRAEVPGYTMTERSRDGTLVERRPADRYVPVAYIAPLRGNAAAVGYDVASEEARREAIDRALEGGRSSATSGVSLVQETGDQAGILVFDPVRSPSGDAVIGFAVGALRVGDRVSSAVSVGLGGDLALRVEDAGAPGEGRPLFGSGGRVEGTPFSHPSEIRVADRRWTVVVEATPAFMDANRTIQAWAILAAGLLLSGLLGMSLLVLTGRTVRVEELVSERTRELEAANTDLREARAVLQHRIEDLAASNAELERFATVASHDLQEPLRTIAGYTRLLQRRYEGRLDTDADSYIAFAVGGAKRMQALIEDLLAYSRITKHDGVVADVDTHRMVTDVRDSALRGLDVRGRIEIGDLPVVRADPDALSQVFHHLLDNAVKFSDGDPDIRVDARSNGDAWEFSVRDRGIGIAAEHAARVFDVFTRLHPIDRYAGTGIGLAIVRKLVESLGGRVWVEPTDGPGATVRFTVPIEGVGESQE